VTIPDAWVWGYAIEVAAALALVWVLGFAAGWWVRGNQ
jgi:hypothetical protein